MKRSSNLQKKYIEEYFSIRSIHTAKMHSKNTYKIKITSTCTFRYLHIHTIFSLIFQLKNTKELNLTFFFILFLLYTYIIYYSLFFVCCNKKLANVMLMEWVWEEEKVLYLSLLRREKYHAQSKPLIHSWKETM